MLIRRTASRSNFRLPSRMTDEKADHAHWLWLQSPHGHATPATSSSIKRSCSESVLPSAYEEGGLFSVMLTQHSTTHRCRITQPFLRIATPASGIAVFSKAVRDRKLRPLPPSSPARLGRL